MVHIYILSDSTGKTAEQALKAGLTQFSETEVEIVVHSNIRTSEQVNKIVAKAAEDGAFIIHTVVSTNMRNFISKTGRLHNVETIDLMGPLLAQLSQQFANSPSEEPGLFRKLNRAYFQRIEAMEFVLRHDDGQRAHELKRAEIVLVGVSRTFKTPISIFLATKGWMTANVPIILDLKPTSELFKLPPERVFGLTSDARNLAMLRQVRHDYLGGATGDYADFEHIRKELVYAHSIFEKNPGWSIIKVTNKPIEEIASQILAILRKRRMHIQNSEITFKPE